MHLEEEVDELCKEHRAEQKRKEEFVNKKLLELEAKMESMHMTTEKLEDAIIQLDKKLNSSVGDITALIHKLRKHG